MTDSQYRQRRAFFDSLMTIYGRKPVLEALRDDAIEFYKLHLADSNRPDGIIREIRELCERRGIPIETHDRRALSRISKNGKQDQGVAADLQLTGYQPVSALLEQKHSGQQLLALDQITNPQNLGMIIRSVCASGIDGLILPRRGCAPLSPLVIKASAGTLFKARIYHCESLDETLRELAGHGYAVSTLSSHAEQSLFDYQSGAPTVFVLGNETEGVSDKVQQLSNNHLRIPMHNGVESLNVAVTAALIAFHFSPRQ